MKNIKLLSVLLLAAAVCACSPQKRVIYIQDISNEDIVKVANNQQIKIKPLDRLTVVVSSKDPELAAPFNVTSGYNSVSGTPIGSGNFSAGNALQVRTVNEQGYLYIPLIGEVFCTGKTRSELAEEIARKIIDGGYISDASVNIQFADMKVAVLGEVSRPGYFDIVRDEITIFDVLSMAGDLTIYGDRTQVKVARKDSTGEYKFYVMDLLTKDGLFDSPAYFIQQGDIIYVSPNRYKAATSEINQNRSFWISLTSTLISVASLVMTIITFAK